MVIHLKPMVMGRPLAKVDGDRCCSRRLLLLLDMSGTKNASASQPAITRVTPKPVED